jgi:hypothetical protein
MSHNDSLVVVRDGSGGRRSWWSWWKFVGGREVVEVVVGGRRLRVRALASTSPMSTAPSWVKRIESPSRADVMHT